MNTCGGQMQRIRVTLDFEVYQDFDARQIDYETLFDIDGQESLTVTVEELHDTKVDSIGSTLIVRRTYLTGDL